jgi:hypothetical protein
MAKSTRRRIERHLPPGKILDTFAFDFEAD